MQVGLLTGTTTKSSTSQYATLGLGGISVLGIGGAVLSGLNLFGASYNQWMAVGSLGAIGLGGIGAIVHRIYSKVPNAETQSYGTCNDIEAPVVVSSKNWELQNSVKESVALNEDDLENLLNVSVNLEKTIQQISKLKSMDSPGDRIEDISIFDQLQSQLIRVNEIYKIIQEQADEIDVSSSQKEDILTSLLDYCWCVSRDIKQDLSGVNVPVLMKSLTITLNVINFILLLKNVEGLSVPSPSLPQETFSKKHPRLKSILDESFRKLQDSTDNISNTLEVKSSCLESSVDNSKDVGNCDLTFYLNKLKEVSELYLVIQYQEGINKSVVGSAESGITRDDLFRKQIEHCWKLLEYVKRDINNPNNDLHVESVSVGLDLIHQIFEEKNAMFIKADRKVLAPGRESDVYATMPQSNVDQAAQQGISSLDMSGISHISEV